MLKTLERSPFDMQQSSDGTGQPRLKRQSPKVSQGQEVGAQEGYDAFCVDATPRSFTKSPKLCDVCCISLFDTKNETRERLAIKARNRCVFVKIGHIEHVPFPRRRLQRTMRAWRLAIQARVVRLFYVAKSENQAKRGNFAAAMAESLVQWRSYAPAVKS